MSTVSIPLNIGSIAASQLLGSLLNFCLYGSLAVQVYAYRLYFPDDKAYIKWLVYCVLALETVMTALNGVDMYSWFAAGFGNMLEFAKPGFSAAYTPIGGSVIAGIVQLFFCYRIWIIQHSALWLSILIALFSLAQAAGGFAGGLLTYILANEDHDHGRSIFVYIWLVGDALTDILIAGAMTVLLTKANLRQQHKETSDILRRIVRLVIETNTLSMLVAIIGLVLFYGAPNTTYFIGPTMVMTKIYSNTLLVTFNNRAFVRRSNKSSIPGSLSQAEAQHISLANLKALPLV